MKVSRGVQEEEERMQELSLDQLRDLNSKLMLITAGSEGKKEVERFSRTLALLELVARHFLDLIQAGCHLFAQWTLKVIVFCNSIRIPVWLICIWFHCGSGSSILGLSGFESSILGLSGFESSSGSGVFLKVKFYN